MYRVQGVEGERFSRRAQLLGGFVAILASMVLLMGLKSLAFVSILNWFQALT